MLPPCSNVKHMKIYNSNYRPDWLNDFQVYVGE